MRVALEQGGSMESCVLGIEEILEILPHRYPFLMIDRVIELEPNKRLVAVKSVTYNEGFFQGHFPGRPVMPGALVLEAMAQAGAILAKKSPVGPVDKKDLYLVGANDMRWKRQVVPGDQLHIIMEFVKRRGSLWIIAGEAIVDGKVVASGTVQAMTVG